MYIIHSGHIHTILPSYPLSSFHPLCFLPSPRPTKVSFVSALCPPPHPPGLTRATLQGLGVELSPQYSGYIIEEYDLPSSAFYYP